ncbi:MAG: preprotein translocase subunit YajC [Oscillospiraceae bacterium]|nr:preprotein translocase subunit YajC [Oscillospiraceae bacterium]MDD7354413.1 preprotein translocase subunit YajC [Oscillospiraceae bacterium]MDY3938436.1 preprotein translocase subunit YajC [Oscillospiraceae bacterium]
MTFSTYLLSCMGQAASGSAEQSKGSSWSMIIMMVALFAIMYFLMIRPQKKKQKEEQEMRDSIQIGDEITTIGGIMGRVVTVKEDSIVLESGADRTKMKFSRWAIQTNDTANERLQAEKDAIAAAKQAEKEEKKKGSRSKKSKSEDKSDKE